MEASRHHRDLLVITLWEGRDGCLHIGLEVERFNQRPYPIHIPDTPHGGYKLEELVRCQRVEEHGVLENRPNLRLNIDRVILGPPTIHQSRAGARLNQPQYRLNSRGLTSTVGT